MPLVPIIVAAIAYAATGALSLPGSQCSPSQHICHGKCPDLPPGVELPRSGWEGLCLRESGTGACVCWLENTPDRQHTQTLFKCQTNANGTRGELMCMPPPFCFSPDDSGPGCMIVPHCPCSLIAGHHGHLYPGWYPVAAILLRSRTPVRPEQDAPTEFPQGGDSREFSMKHLLFLLAFVIAPLLCWCLLTFFHEGKCRKKRCPCPEAQPMPTDRADEVTTTCPSSPAPQHQEPTAPKLLESPPPYRVALDPGESCLLPPVDCGPPPSYEDAVRNPGWPTAIRIHETNDP